MSLAARHDGGARGKSGRDVFHEGERRASIGIA
jgi:hypothetical protein